ncbi:MAG: hypothetical protein KJN85_09735 [Maribacter sp.]|nr:hypothetical protein [Maribacter sp.]MBT8314025.1 hypothetical protein [Maribacter sp.]
MFMNASGLALFAYKDPNVKCENNVGVSKKTLSAYIPRAIFLVVSVSSFRIIVLPVS